MNLTNVKLIETMVTANLSRQERSLLIINLMRADGYHVDDVYTILDDVLLFEEWKPLADKLIGDDAREVLKRLASGIGQISSSLEGDKDALLSITEMSNELYEAI